MIARELLVAFFVILLMSVPLWPAILEALRPSDEEPLTISRYQLQDARGTPKQVSWRYTLMFGLTEPSQLADWLKRQLAGELAPGVAYLAGGGELPREFAGTDALAAGSLRLASGDRSGARLFSLSEVVVGEGAEAFEAHASGWLRLERACRLQWWGTAASIRLARDAQAMGALRAEKEIVAELGSRFHSLRAPAVHAVHAEQAAEAGDPAPATSDEPRALASATPPTRLVVDQDHEIPDGQVHHGDLIIRGNLRIGAGARILGAVKSHGSVTLGPGASVRGAVVARVGVRMETGASVGGCVLGESWISLETGCRVGRPGHPASVSAETVRLSPGACVHGLVRAWKGGYVAET